MRGLYTTAASGQDALACPVVVSEIPAMRGLLIVEIVRDSMKLTSALLCFKHFGSMGVMGFITTLLGMSWT